MGLTEMDLEGVDRIDLAQDKDDWWAFVSTVISLVFRKKRGV
jgi:hypothetical protein